MSSNVAALVLERDEHGNQRTLDQAKAIGEEVARDIATAEHGAEAGVLLMDIDHLTTLFEPKVSAWRFTYSVVMD